MLNISFKRNSLLYGESCFLVAYLIFIPYFFWPDLFKTRTKHLLLMTKTRRAILKLVINLWDFFLVRFIVLGLILSTQIPYALILVTFGTIVQKDSLVVLLGLTDDELAYKALYYAPILYRLGTFLMILLALWNRNDYRAWPTLDHYDVFSISRSEQLHIIIFCGLIIVPDIMCSWIDTMLMFTFLRSDRHQWFQFTRSTKFINFLFVFTATCINATCCITRYKPLVSILYSTLCVRKHMRLLKSQLYLSFIRTNTSTVGLLMSRLGEEAKGAEAGHKSASELWPRGASGGKRAGGLSRERLEVEQMREQKQMALYIDSQVSVSRKQSAMEEVSPRDLIWGAEEPAGWHEDPLYEIRTLFEFEKHLTQIYLFVASMDRCSPGALFVLTFFNLIAFFYAYLYIRALPYEYANLFYAILYLSSRIMPVCILFIAGHLMELECRKIANLVEMIYLERSSHSLLYRQLGDSQHSLARIFRLLSWIKFDGDGLMAINLDSLKRLLFYVSSAIFIVIQYDSLLIIEEDSPGGPPTAPSAGSEAPLGADRSNLSQWLQISLT